MASPAISAQPDRESDAVRGRYLLLFALALTTLAYLATLRFEFVYDDISQIVNNRTLDTWKTLPTLFTAHTWKFLQPDWGGNYYRPLFMTWLLLNRKLFGLSPVMFHATTLLVHLAATWLTYLVAKQVLRNPLQAGYTALLFGLHPVHVEAVAWISGVTEPLMAVFMFAAFWFWIESERRPEKARLFQIWALFFYVCGCLSKETALLLPMVIVAYEVLLQSKGRLQAVRQTLPFWITAAVYMVVRFLALHGLFQTTLQPQPASYLLLTLPWLVCGYVGRMVWPIGLSIFYNTPPVVSPLQVRFWLPTVALVVLVIVGWKIVRRSQISKLAIVWFFVFLSPAILGLRAFALGEWFHDRYLYLPSFGFCLLAALAISKIKSEKELFGIPAAPLLAIIILSTVMAFDTAYEEQFWANNMMLFLHANRITPQSPWAAGKLAAEFVRRGDFKTADRVYQEAIQLDPANWTNQLAYGLMLYFGHDFERADRQFDRAIPLMPGDSNQYFYQGMSRFDLHRYPAAEQAFRQAIAAGPKRARYHFWLGFSLEQQGRLSEAIAEFEKELAQHPETDTSAQEHLERLKLQAGTGPASIQARESAGRN